MPKTIINQTKQKKSTVFQQPVNSFHLLFQKNKKKTKKIGCLSSMDCSWTREIIRDIVQWNAKEFRFGLTMYGDRWIVGLWDCCQVHKSSRDVQCYTLLILVYQTITPISSAPAIDLCIDLHIVFNITTESDSIKSSFSLIYRFSYWNHHQLPMLSPIE